MFFGLIRKQRLLPWLLDWRKHFKLLVLNCLTETGSQVLNVPSSMFFFCPPPFAKAGDIKTHSSVCQSVCHKNFNLAHIFWSINDRALIFGMHDPCDKPCLLIPCCDLDLDLWPTSRSNLLPGGGFKQVLQQRWLSICYDIGRFWPGVQLSISLAQ